MIRAFSLAIAQLLSPAVLRVLIKSAALTVLLCTLLGVAGWAGLRAAATHYPGVAAVLESPLAVILLAVLAIFLLFRAVAMLVIGLFSDAVVAATEQQFYPAAASDAATVTVRQGAMLGLRSLGRTIGYNLLAVPLYVIAAPTAIGLPLALVAVNALLLGRDLEAMLRARHPTAPALSRRSQLSAGGVTAALFLIPGANLLAPIVGTAMAVHLFHQRRKT